MLNSKLQTPKTKTFLKGVSILFSLFISSAMYSQAGAKWATGGNGISNGDFLGTTNAYSLVFKTNSVQRAAFSSTGIFQVNNLAGAGTGFVSLDANGNLIRTDFPSDPNKVLNGSGNFVTFSSASGWSFSGNNLSNINSGNVGIGISNPQFKLDVNGDANVNGTLYAHGLVLATKMLADTMATSSVGVVAVGTGGLKSAGMLVLNNNLNLSGGVVNEIYTQAGNLQMQSTPGYNGNTILNSGTTGKVGIGTSSPQYKFDVNGDERVNGKFYSFRIVPLPGDSLIRFGDSTIYINSNRNQITTSIHSSNQSSNIDGLTLGWGNGAYAYGTQSLALGAYVSTTHVANNSVVIGSGIVAAQHPHVLENNIPNSLMIGFNSDVPTLFVSASTGAGTTGAVCIGDTYIPNGYKLAVNGKIIAEEINVKLRGTWPDYVFDSTFVLMPISEFRKSLLKEKRLPFSRSSTQIQKDGISLSEIAISQQKEIEVQALYILQCDDRLNEQQKQLDVLQKEIEELKKINK